MVAVDWGRVLPCVVVIDMDVKFWTVTVTVPVPLMPCAVAVMVAVPVETPVTSPPFEIVATVSSELDQPTVDPESGCLLPSEKVPVAISCCVPLRAIVVEAGVIKIELIVGFTKKPVQPAHARHRRMAIPVASPKRRLRPSSRRTVP